MPILDVRDNLDGVPEAEKKLFTEVDGRFQREIKIEDTSGLKKALADERKTVKDIQAKLSRFDGLDLEELKKFQKKAEEGMSDVEKLTAALKKSEDKIADLEKKSAADLADKDAKLQKYHLDAKSRKAALKAGVIPEDIDDVLVLTKKNRTLDNEGKIVIVDADGDPTAKTLDDFFGKDFKALKPKFYAGINGGGGATPNMGGGLKTNAELLKLSPTERLNKAREQAS